MPTSPPAPHDPIHLELWQENLTHTGTARFCALGSSMVPVLFPNDTVVIEKADFSTIAIGDIIATVVEDRLRLHRATKIQADAVTTHGDAVRDADPPVPASAVVGKVRGRLAHNGELIIFSRNRGWWRNGIAKACRHSTFLCQLVVGTGLRMGRD